MSLKKWRSMDLFNFSAHESPFMGKKVPKMKSQDDNRVVERSPSIESSDREDTFNRIAQSSASEILRHRRLGSQSSVKSDESKKDETTDSSQTSASSVPLIQRVAIVQKDEKGYGLTVSGDNPVYVQSVKPDGAAAKAGVQKGDRIIKVNGTLVTNSNHIEVVKMIKSGSYVALTLLGKPQTIPPNRESIYDRESGSSRDSVMDRITNPQPVNVVLKKAEKDREMKQQKLTTLQNMYCALLEEYEKLRKSRNSSGEKYLTQLQEKERLLKGLDAQIRNLQGLGPPDPNASPHLREVDVNNTDTAPWLPGGPKHYKYSSMPASTMRPIQEVTGPTRYGNVARSKSDVSGRKMAVIESMTTTDGQTYRRTESSPETSSVPTAVSDLGSMSDSPQNSPSTSPTPLHPQNIDTDTLPHDSGIDDGSISSVGTFSGSRTTHQIIGMDDDDFTSEDELTGDSRVFTDISTLENKPAHMAIFLHYILSQHDPSAVLFYLMASYYSQAQGNTKDLKKWAYEIHSTFLVHQAPLKVKVDDSVVTNIDQTLQYKSEKDEPLRSIFNVARNIARNEVQELLSDFRQKKEKGLIHGAHELKDNMDKNEETRLIEQYLVPDLERSLQYKKSLDEDSVPPDKFQAQGWAISTFLRNWGTKLPLHSSAAERSLSFIMKDKRSSKFLSRINKSKSQKGHQFNLQHFQKVEFCMHCNGVLWGVGHQGYLCQSCEQCVHKHCLEELEEQCTKKRKSRAPVPGMIPFRKSVPPSTNTRNSIYTPTQFYPTVGEIEKEVSSPTVVPAPTNIFSVQPLKDPEDKELNIFRESGHSVTQLVSKYEQAVSPEPGTEGEKEQKKGIDLNRSESLKGRGDPRNDRPTRRSKSDVDMDDHLLKALNASGSSSSSLSNRSGESPVGSTDTLTQQIQEDSDFDVEPDLPSLKQVLGEEVLKKLKPKEKKRQDVINELFYTERNHLKNLKILDKLFYKPMMADPNISQEFTKSLFPNLETMIALHSSLNKSFKERRKEKPVVQSVGDLLVARFDGEAGENFRNGCAIFCRNQSHALENLKVRIRKDARLAQLLADAENNPLCQRLSLKDFIPRQMMRLTKYPLLIENLLKYTSSTGDEYSNLEHAHQRCKHILEFVNQAVKDCENHQRLIDLHKRIDKKIDNVSEMDDLRTFDIREQTLVYDGSLTWRINNRKQIELHVVLMEKAMVLLQKQEDRLVLKCQSTQLVQGKDDAKRHSPLLWLNNVLARNDATDKRAFFVVNTSHSGPQIYQLVAATAEEQKKWTKLITQFSEMVKTKQIISTRNTTAIQQPTLPQEITVEREQLQRPSVQGLSEIDENLTPSMEGSLDLDLIHQTDDMMTNTVHMTPSEKLEANSKRIKELLDERQWIVNDLLKVTPPSKNQGEHTEMLEEDDPQSLILSVQSLSVQLLEYIRGDSPSTIDPADTVSRDSGEGVLDTIEDLTVPIPMDRLREMSHRMNNILTNLLSAVNSRDEERDRLRRELKIAQEELNKLRQIQKAAEPFINSMQARPQNLVSGTVSDSIDENPENEIQTELSKLESNDQEAVAAGEMEERAGESEETPKARFELSSHNEAVPETSEENIAEKCQSLSEAEEEVDEMVGASDPVAEDILCEIEPPEEEELQDLEIPVIEFLDPTHCGETDTDFVETSKENGQAVVNIVTSTSEESFEDIHLFQKSGGHIPSFVGGTCDNIEGSSTEEKEKQREDCFTELLDATNKLDDQEGGEDDDNRYESSDDTLLGSEKDLELDANQVIETESRALHDIDSLNSQNHENVISECKSELRDGRTVDGSCSVEGREDQQTELSEDCGDIQVEDALNQTTDIDSYNEEISKGDGSKTESASEDKNAASVCSDQEQHLCPSAFTADNSVTSEEVTTSPVEI